MSVSDKHKLFIVLGPTATGKTRFAAVLANELNAEIISADSRQVYKHMDLGTGKDYDDYIVNGVKVPNHLIDIHDPGYKYNVYEFQSDFFQKLDEIESRNKQVVLCGGTGMYIESVTKGYKLISVPVNEELRRDLQDKTMKELEETLSEFKNLHNRSDTDTLKRAIRAIEIAKYYQENNIEETPLPNLNPIFFGIAFSRDERRARITERLEARIRGGLLDEVKFLLESNVSPDDLIYYGLEYKFITQHIIGDLNYTEMVERLNVAIHQFAKRQMTWFRKMEREGVKINWIDGALSEEEKLAKALKIIG